MGLPLPCLGIGSVASTLLSRPGPLLAAKTLGDNGEHRVYGGIVGLLGVAGEHGGEGVIVSCLGVAGEHVTLSFDQILWTLEPYGCQQIFFIIELVEFH